MFSKLRGVEIQCSTLQECELMNNKQGHPRFPSEKADCPRCRLAQGSIAAVDACDCGMIQVHVGAFTFRLAPCAFAELVGTFNQALAVHAKRSSDHSAGVAPFLVSRERGEA
jgi:hypothetical protein